MKEIKLRIAIIQNTLLSILSFNVSMECLDSKIFFSISSCIFIVSLSYAFKYTLKLVSLDEYND